MWMMLIEKNSIRVDMVSALILFLNIFRVIVQRQLQHCKMKSDRKKVAHSNQNV
jgi:hypothetical protein